MKAGIVVSGTGAILLLTACNSLDDPNLVSCLHKKGVNKYIVFEVPIDLVKTQYGQRYSIALADRKQSDECRVVDVDGSRIFRNFSLSDFGQPLMQEEPAIRRKAA
ncbi:MAG: hypothetical protein AAGU11_21955 [Syntrophobacteraceae bacterium]